MANSVLVVPLAAGVLLCELVIVALVWRRRKVPSAAEIERAEAAFSELERALGGESLLPRVFSARHAGEWVQARLSLPSRRKPLRFELCIGSDRRVAPSIHPGLSRAQPVAFYGRSSSIPRLLRKHPRRGGAPFDRDVHIETDMPEDELSHITVDAQLRDSVWRLLHLGFFAVMIQHDSGAVCAYAEATQHMIQAERVVEATEALSGVKGAMPRGLAMARNRRAFPLAVALWSGSMGVAVSGWTGLAIVASALPVRSAVAWAGVACGCTVWAGVLGAMTRLLRGRTNATNRLAASLSLMALGIVPHCVTVLVAATELFRPPFEHTGVVEQK